jgi:DNA gyrase inhibitor GyrI
MENKMPDLEVNIVRLEPMTVASSRAFGSSPESKAWDQLRAWAEPRGLLEDLEAHPVFGFNNPNPTPDTEEYGYEFWISIDLGEEPSGNIEIKDFAGGWYAVTFCRLTGDPNILESWKLLWAWVQNSEYKWLEAHGLEKLVDPMAPEDELELELFLPIEEPATQ